MTVCTWNNWERLIKGKSDMVTHKGGKVGKALSNPKSTKKQRGRLRNIQLITVKQSMKVS